MDSKLRFAAERQEWPTLISTLLSKSPDADLPKNTKSQALGSGPPRV